MGVDDIGCEEYLRSHSPYEQDAPLEEIIKQYSHRMAWEDYIEVTLEEYTMYQMHVYMALSDTVFMQCMRAWIETTRKNESKYAGGYALTNPENVMYLHATRTPESRLNIRGTTVEKFPCRHVNPMEDMRAYFDAVFLNERPPESSEWITTVENTSNGYNKYREMMDKRDKGKTTESLSPHSSSSSSRPCHDSADEKKTAKSLAEMMSHDIFETYAERIVEEAEHRTPKTMAIVAQLMAVRNGVMDLYEHVVTQARPPGTMLEKGNTSGIGADEPVPVSWNRIKTLYDSAKAIEDMLNQNVELYGTHIKMKVASSE